MRWRNNFNFVLLQTQIYYQIIAGTSSWAQTTESSINYDCISYDSATNVGEDLEFYIKKPTTDKCWFIKFPEEKWITLTFSYLNILGSSESSEYSCSNYVQVEDVQNKSLLKNNQQQKYCGNVLPKAISMHSSYVVIRLHTENYPISNYKHMGFILNYTVACKLCDNSITVQSYDFITTCNYPRQYPMNTCTWNVTLEANLPLQITFNDFDIDDSTHITVYDGVDEKATVLVSNVQPYDGLGWWSNALSIDFRGQTFTTSGSHLYVTFQSGLLSSHIYRGFNATVKAKGYCLPGSYSCGDQSTCYKEQDRCNGVRNCENGFDEMGCGDCPADQLWCGVAQGDCYYSSEYCDGKKDCRTNSDEIHCNSCSKGAFFCKLDHRCIYERWRCDGQIDCADESDERDCVYTASRRVITATIVGSLICGLLLSVALGCTCKLYTLRSSSSARQRSRMLMPTPLGRIARELMEREAPPSYRMCIDGVEVDVGERSHSSSGRRRSRRHRRSRRNREPHIRRAQPLPNTSQEVNATRHISSSSQNSTTRSSSGTQSSINNESSSGVLNILSHFGISTTTTTRPLPPLPTPSNTSRNENGSSRHDVVEPSTSSTTSSGYSEIQAKPLPKKRKILPVLVEAPCNEISVEDIPGCLYPNPPPYSEAIQVSTVSSPPDRTQEDAESSDSSTTGSFTRFLQRHSPIKKRNDWKLPFVKIFSAVRSNASPLRHDPLEEEDAEDIDQGPLDDFVELGSHPITREQVEETLKIGRNRAGTVTNNNDMLVSVSQFYAEQNTDAVESTLDAFDRSLPDENSIANTIVSLQPSTSGYAGQTSDTMHLQLSELSDDCNGQQGLLESEPC